MYYITTCTYTTIVVYIYYDCVDDGSFSLDAKHIIANKAVVVTKVDILLTGQESRGVI